MYLAVYFLCCRMTKQKRKVTKMTDKKNKKWKKASAQEILLAPEAEPGSKEAHPQVGATVAFLSPGFLIWGGLGGRVAGVRVGGAEAGTGYKCLLQATVGQVRISVSLRLEHHDCLSTAIGSTDCCVGCHTKGTLVVGRGWGWGFRAVP